MNIQKVTKVTKLRSLSFDGGGELRLIEVAIATDASNVLELQ